MRDDNGVSRLAERVLEAEPLQFREQVPHLILVGELHLLSSTAFELTPLPLLLPLLVAALWLPASTSRNSASAAAPTTPTALPTATPDPATLPPAPATALVRLLGLPPCLLLLPLLLLRIVHALAVNLVVQPLDLSIPARLGVFILLLRLPVLAVVVTAATLLLLLSLSAAVSVPVFTTSSAASSSASASSTPPSPTLLQLQQLLLLLYVILHLLTKQVNQLLVLGKDFTLRGMPLAILACGDLCRRA